MQSGGSNPSVAHMPLPLTPAEADEFRRVLAGLADPNPPPQGVAVEESVRRESISFVGCLANLYGRANRDDPMKMWEHIVKALNITAAAADGLDFSAFACHCVDALGIPPEMAACDDEFNRWLVEFTAGDARAARVVAYLTGPTQVAAVAHARNERKKGQTIRTAARGQEAKPTGDMATEAAPIVDEAVSSSSDFSDMEI